VILGAIVTIITWVKIMRFMNHLKPHRDLLFR